MMQTSDIIEIKGSRLKLTGLFALGVLMTALSAAVAFGSVPARDAVVGWLGLLFSGYCTAVLFRRLLIADRAVLTITPNGIRDIRISTDFVPWSGICDITSRRVRGQRFIVIGADPAVERHLALTATAKWSRGLNHVLGLDGLCISATGLQINHYALFKTCLTYWQASGRHPQTHS